MKKIFLILSLLLLWGCSDNQKFNVYDDPLEPYNRKMYSFNQFFDGMIMKPLAVGYKNIAPTPINYSVSSFFSNILDVTVIINDLFQLNFQNLKNNIPRFLFNTTFGALGFIDVSTSLGFEKKDNDFGLTLADWGYKNSNYFVFPILGPSTIRDSVGRVVDAVMPTSPFRLFILDGNHRIGIFALKFIDIRADLLGVTNVVNTASIDEYAFVRDAYLQRRESLIMASASKPEPSDKSKKGMSEAVNVLIEDEHFGDAALFADALKEVSKKNEEKKEAKEELEKKSDKETKSKTNNDIKQDKNKSTEK